MSNRSISRACGRKISSSQIKTSLFRGSSFTVYTDGKTLIIATHFDMHKVVLFAGKIWGGCVQLQRQSFWHGAADETSRKPRSHLKCQSLPASLWTKDNYMTIRTHQKVCTWTRMGVRIGTNFCGNWNVIRLLQFLYLCGAPLSFIVTDHNFQYICKSITNMQDGTCTNFTDSFIPGKKCRGKNWVFMKCQSEFCQGKWMLKISLKNITKLNGSAIFAHKRWRALYANR